MSNPLLKSNDPRFQKPDVRDAKGKNPFGESGEDGDSASRHNNPFAAASEPRPFEPRFESQQRSRAGLWLFLGGVGWGAALVGAVSLAGLLDIGWFSPLLGVIPSGAAWLLAYEELKAARLGVIAGDAATRIRHALWLGFTAALACASIVVAMVYREMNILPPL